MSERDEHGELEPSTLPDDCTVLSIAAAQDSVWVATDAGLWRQCGGIWGQVTAPPAIPVVATIVRAGCAGDPGGALLAAGLAGGAQYLPDGGEHWFGAWLDDITSSITGFAVSPRFATDRVMLAGTEIGRAHV